jgi:hypothetical protein
MTTTVNVYWASSDRDKGWWVASWRSGPSTVRIARVRRDPQKDAKAGDILHDASRVVPVSEWHRASRGDRLVGWTGELDLDALAAMQ